MAKTYNLHYGANNINFGPLRQLPEVCIDRFFGDALKSTCFFLSHAHTDHMVGLETTEFLDRINQENIYLYCHALTPVLLGAFENYMDRECLHELIQRKKIRPLNVNTQYTIHVSSFHNQSHALEVKVTLLPAGHCPGSVMFLFEFNGKRILHTGDFRLTVDDLREMDALFTDSTKKRLKPIDHLYIDTTFCNVSASQFPCRKAVFEQAVHQMRQWIQRSPNHAIFISFAAKFAHEYILLELHKIFGCKIHVSHKRWKVYVDIPELRQCCSPEAIDTPFHYSDKDENECGKSKKFLTLRLSSMWFTLENASSMKSHLKLEGSKLFLCYSMHSSLHELGATINFLKPKNVTPLVLPIDTPLPEVESTLKSVCKVPFKYKVYHRLKRNSDPGNYKSQFVPVPYKHLQKSDHFVSSVVKRPLSDAFDIGQSKKQKSELEPEEDTLSSCDDDWCSTSETVSDSTLNVYTEQSSTSGDKMDEMTESPPWTFQRSPSHSSSGTSSAPNSQEIKP